MMGGFGSGGHNRKSEQERWISGSRRQAPPRAVSPKLAERLADLEKLYESTLKWVQAAQQMLADVAPRSRVDASRLLREMRNQSLLLVRLAESIGRIER